MKAQLIGRQIVNFTNSNGEIVKGTNYFVAFRDENVEGLRTEKLYAKEGIELPKDVKLNDMLEIYFNHKGKIEQICKAN